MENTWWNHELLWFSLQSSIWTPEGWLVRNFMKGNMVRMYIMSLGELDSKAFIWSLIPSSTTITDWSRHGSPVDFSFCSANLPWTSLRVWDAVVKYDWRVWVSMYSSAKYLRALIPNCNPSGVEKGKKVILPSVSMG